MGAVLPKGQLVGQLTADRFGHIKCLLESSSDAAPTVNATIWVMTLDLTAEESAALTALLQRTIADDRYPLSPRILTLQSILDRIDPPPATEPLPPLRHYEPPRAKASRRRG
jgi:hypothetical protein